MPEQGAEEDFYGAFVSLLYGFLGCLFPYPVLLFSIRGSLLYLSDNVVQSAYMC